jgi:hypothetical protein
MPADLAARYNLGQLQRFGTILKDVSTGQIAGHLQEASRLSSAISSGFNPFVQAGQLASSVAANVQLEQVKNMLGTLQLMTGATLAVSAVGLGVSVAGFVYVSKKLDTLAVKLGAMEGTLAEIRSDIHEIDVRQRARDRAAITSLMASGEAAWTRTDKIKVWQELESRLSLEEHYYRALLDVTGPSRTSILFDGMVDWQGAVGAHEALTHLVMSRLKTLLLLNEMEAAEHYACEWRDWLRANFRNVSASNVVDQRLATQQSIGGKPNAATEPRLELLSNAESFVGIWRVQQEFADTLPLLIEELRRQGIDGRDYIERLRNEKQTEILVLEPR